jgi:hypothetical protein
VTTGVKGFSVRRGSGLHRWATLPVFSVGDAREEED